MKGVTICEIGGSNLEVLEKLGARVFTYQGEFVTPGNYQKIMIEAQEELGDLKFDITSTRMVFDEGSGIERMPGVRDYKDACSKLTDVLAKITKQGGYSIHLPTDLQGESAEEFIEKEQLPSDLGHSIIVYKREGD